MKRVARPAQLEPHAHGATALNVEAWLELTTIRAFGAPALTDTATEHPAHRGFDLCQASEAVTAEAVRALLAGPGASGQPSDSSEAMHAIGIRGPIF